MAGIRPQGTVPGMLDPRRLRTDLDAMKAALARRGDDTSALDRAAELDRLHREVAGRRDGARAEVKRLSVEVRTATLVRTDTMVSTGHLPKFADDAYHVERDDLWAIPTAEVPLTSLARDEVLDEADLPMRLMAHTSCFRREAGSAGRDTRGVLRVHEFDKVELLAYATAEQSAEVHAELLARAEGTLRALGLAYRDVDLA